jgi:hypothetical protein
MPGLDTTGPLGQGPMTGWGEGRCSADVTQPSPLFAGRGRGGYWPRGGFKSRWGRGFRKAMGRRGRGFGMGGAYAARRQTSVRRPADTETTELEALKREAKAYAQHLERVEARIAELEVSPEASPATTEST